MEGDRIRRLSAHLSSGLNVSGEMDYKPSFDLPGLEMELSSYDQPKQKQPQTDHRYDMRTVTQPKLQQQQQQPQTGKKVSAEEEQPSPAV